MLGLGLATSKGGFVDVLAEVTNTKSIIFDGGDEYIQFNDLDIVTDNFTISGWAKPTDASDFQVIMSKWDDGTSANSVFRIVLSGSVCICALKKTGGSTLATSTTTTILTDGLWFHFAFTNDGSNLKGYINGVLQDTDSTTSGDLNTSDQNFLLGGQYNGASVVNEFGGNLDEIAIWNEALTQAEITQIYNSNKATLDLSTDTGNYSSSANLKAWWRMGDEASTRVVDDNANNLVIPDMRKTFFTGKSIDFDGSDDYIEVSDSDNLSFGDGSSDSAFSISAWIYMDDATNFQILNKGVFNTDGEYNFRTNSSDKLVFALYDESVASTHESVVSSAITSYEGQWIHVVGTYDGTGGTSANSGLELYINGSNATDTRSGGGTYVAMENLAGNVRIGRLDTNYGNGKICDVAIWNTELDANTVASIYNSGEPNNLLLSASYTAGSGVDKTANLQAYYRMGNGSIDAFSNSSQTGIGLIADYTNATLGTALVPNLSDDGNGNGSNWTLTALAEWTINTNTATAFEATTDSDIDGTADAKLYVKTSNSGLSADIPAGVYKITGTLSTTSTLPSSNCRFVWYGGYATNIHNLSAGNFEIYELCTSSSNNHHFQFQTSTEGHNFKLENVKFEPVNGNAGITINMSEFDVVDHAPNRNSGDMINFDATADIETDTPTQIYTVTNTKSVLFDGVNDFIQFESLSLSGVFTVSIWLKLSDLTFNGLFGSDDTLDYITLDDNNVLKIRTGGGSETSITHGLGFTTGEWQNFVLTRDSSNVCTVYRNGIASGTTGTQSGTFASNIIGAKNESGSFLNGNTDEVAVWNVELSASQVAQIYHGSQANFDLSQNGGGYTSASNLQAWWRMGDGTIDEFPLIGDQTNTTLGSELIPNNGFEGTLEVASSTGDVDKWLDANGNAGQSSTASLDTSSPRTGSNCLKVTLGNTYGYLNYVLNTTEIGVYKFSFFYRAGDSQTINSIRAGGTLSLRAFQLGDSGHQSPVDETYREMVVYFQNTAVQTIRLSLQINGTTGDFILIDDMSCKKVQGNAGFMNNMASSAIETDTP